MDSPHGLAYPLDRLAPLACTGGGWSEISLESRSLYTGLVAHAIVEGRPRSFFTMVSKAILLVQEENPQFPRILFLWFRLPKKPEA